jgi:hypothetical protein
VSGAGRSSPFDALAALDAEHGVEAFSIGSTEAAVSRGVYGARRSSSASGCTSAGTRSISSSRH